MRLVLPQDVPVTEIMVRDPITIGPDEPVEQARRLFRINHIGGLPVVDNGKLVGIFTLVDLKRVRKGRNFVSKVKDFMTKDPYVGHTSDTLGSIYDTMSRKAVGRIPIVSEDESLLGLVSFNDLKDVSKLHSQKESDGRQLVKLICPSPGCGAPLPMPVSRFVTCKYCGMTSFLKL